MPSLPLLALGSLLGALLWPLARTPPLPATLLACAALLLSGLCAHLRARDPADAPATVRPTTLAAALLLAGACLGLARVALGPGGAPPVRLIGELHARGVTEGAATGREVTLRLADVAVQGQAGDPAWTPTRGVLRLRVPYGETAPPPGTLLLAEGHAEPLDPTYLPGDADPTPAWVAQGLRVRLRARTLVVLGRPPPAPRTTLPDGRPALHAGLLRAMVDGGREDIPPAEAELLRNTGTWHLVSISGLHVGLAAAAAAALAGALARTLAGAPGSALARGARWAATLTGVAAAWGYAALAGTPPAARRAACMTTALLLCRAGDRRPGMPEVLALSWLGVLAAEPGAPWDLGAQLSFASLAGILLLGPRVMRWVPPDRPLLTLLAGSLAASVGATLGTLPIVAWRIQQVAPLGVFANLWAVPLISAVATPALLAGQLLPAPLGPWAILLADVATHLALEGVRPLAVTPWAPAVGPWGALALAGALLLRRDARAMMAVIVLVLGVRTRPRSLTVTFLAVGQGDAALVEWPDGRTWLVDGGPPGDALLRWLRRKGVRTLDAVVLSHPHPDHLGGLLPVVRALSVREVRAPRPPRTADSEPDFTALLAAARTPTGEPAPLLHGTAPATPAGVTLLHPLPAFLDVALSPRARTERVNDESLVLRLSHAGRSVLFPGDVEREGEEALVAAAAARPLKADVLKLPHHGSRTSSSPAFLDAVDPAWAVVSCGFANRYGHPHPVTLRSLARAGVRVLRTDEQGSVVVRIADDGALTVTTESPPAGGWAP